MEFAIAIFIGIWMTVSVALAYLGLKKDYKKEESSGGFLYGQDQAPGKGKGKKA